MRRYRMGLIQTAEQLRFSYQSIIEGADALGIDLRRTTQYEDQSNEVQSSEESDYSDDDESISEEDSEQDIDLTPPERPPRIISNQNSPRSEDAVANDVDEPPPPIPPRAESLSSPGMHLRWITLAGNKVLYHLTENYDRPLPLRPKRPRVDVDGSTTSETEEEVVEPVGEAPNNEIERKRRKQMDEASPR